jgi:hypothetical protein
MAKPIRATPELTGEEANEFLRKMIKVERAKMTQEQKRLAKEIEKNMSSLLVC